MPGTASLLASQARQAPRPPFRRRTIIESALVQAAESTGRDSSASEFGFEISNLRFGSRAPIRKPSADSQPAASVSGRVPRPCRPCSLAGCHGRAGRALYRVRRKCVAQPSSAVFPRRQKPGATTVSAVLLSVSAPRAIHNSHLPLASFRLTANWQLASQSAPNTMSAGTPPHFATRRGRERRLIGRLT